MAVQRATRVLVSACLLGRACRFDGRDQHRPDLEAALAQSDVEAVPFCPEEAGGLGTPRPAAQLHGGSGEDVIDGRARVIDEQGTDVTDAFLAGAEQALATAQQAGCEVAYLKERSPSCGSALVHLKTGLVSGSGVTAAMLRRAGIPTISVD